MAEQKILLGNVRGEQGPAGPNMVSSGTTTSGFENGHVLFNNNGKVGAKKLSASDVGALASDGTAKNANKLVTNGKEFEAWKLQCLNDVGSAFEFYVLSRYLKNIPFFALNVTAGSTYEYPVCAGGIQCIDTDETYNKGYKWVVRSVYQKHSALIFGLEAIGYDGSSTQKKDCSVKYAVQLTTASSKRYKTDVREVDAAQLDRLMELDVIDFIYNDAAPENLQDGKRHVGVIAEQLAEIMPDSVIRDENGTPSSVIYSDFIPLLLAQLQRQKAQIDALEQCIRKLEEGKA